MDIEKLRSEFYRLLEMKKYDYSAPEVVKKGQELENKIYDAWKPEKCKEM